MEKALLEITQPQLNMLISYARIGVLREISYANRSKTRCYNILKIENIAVNYRKKIEDKIIGYNFILDELAKKLVKISNLDFANHRKCLGDN